MTIRFRASVDEKGPPGLQAYKAGDVFPGRMTPVIRADANGALVWEVMQWGFPPFKGTRPVCHVANIGSVFWRPWLKPHWRCAIPVEAFSEYSAVDHKAHWFGPSEGEVFWLAALWRPLSGKRTLPLAPPEQDPRVFALVNAPPNRLIAEHHPQSMPTILRKSERDTWLMAPKEIAIELRRPLNANLLRHLN